MNTIKNKLKLLLFAIVTTLSFTAFKAYKKTMAPVEKIYTQTDRPFYFPGETIWFKSYLVNQDHTISNISDVVHAQLISPRGTVVNSLKLAAKDGYVYGDFYVDSNWVGGIYTLKVFTNWMRNFGEDSFFTKQITVQKVVKPNLLLKLEFEKEGYGKSSDVIANFEAKDLNNNLLTEKEITFEVTIKGEHLLTQTIKTDAYGKAKPTFTLPNDLESTDVVLNVLIPHNGSTEAISRAVPIVLDTIDLQFFAESGQLIAGTENTIAFKAINEFAKPVDVSGDIVNGKGQIVANFSSFHDGMGSVTISAEKGEQYVAKLKTPFVSTRIVRLPQVENKGTRFTVKTQNSKAELKLFSSENEPLLLEVSNATAVLFQKKVTPNRKPISIDTEDFPMGISTFSIKNSKGNIVAERLVFINANKELCIDIEMEKTVYQTREKVNLTITTSDSNGNPIPSNLSISVADNKLLSFADDKQDHILSYLLLSSELKGKIHEPSFYFNPNEEKSTEALDYLMLTHGWRNHRDEAKANIETTSFLPEQHATQSGFIVDKKGNPTTAHLLLLDQFGNKILVFDTKDDGSYSFKLGDNRSLVLLAYRDDKTPVTIKKFELNRNQIANQKLVENEMNTKKVETFKTKDKSPRAITNEQQAVASIAMDEDQSALDEVVITGYAGATNSSKITSAVATVSSESIISVPTNSIDQLLQGQAAGVNVSTGSGQPGQSATILIRGRNSLSGDVEPLFIVDGVPVDQSNFRNLSSSNIKSMTVLKDAAATAVYGNRAAGGVIVISTNNGYYINNYGKKKLNNRKYKNYAVEQFTFYKPIGIDQPKQFYIPKYESKDVPEERTDFRETIYWNPVVQTDENGKAELEFYNSDAITSFKITAEGISYNGKLGRIEKTYATKKLLNVDFKAPNYMALEDEVILPITIINNTENPIEADLNISLPEHLKFANDYEKKVSIAANSSVLKNVAVIPVKTVKNTTIYISVKSKKHSDIVKKEVTILSPYFPTATSISGSSSKAFKFDINSVVPGSLQAEFNLYTDVIGDVMDGIDALIREPYGCFEQTSSSTYPNIMVLQYLKESGKSNQEIEAKALDFIERGYKRLISFETRENGFEWFGKTPPHETLTAYGVLEFTEMKSVFDGVDQKMIDRTVKWLMSRKDGNGGFKKSEKGYDSFRSSTIDVANAYIVYAISESGVDANVSFEYQTAFKDALKSKDTYKMAMMALASYNLEETENAAVLLSEIKKNISTYDFDKLPVEETITKSYGNAKNLETTAFTLLALMREKNPDDALIAKGIEYLVGQRQHNRFGSTQSTAMALKALITYTKQQKQKVINENDSVEIVINGKSLNSKLQISANGKITVDGLGAYLKQGKQNVVVRFNNEKSTFPYTMAIGWDSYVPDSSTTPFLDLKTSVANQSFNVGDNVSMTIDVKNLKNESLGMVTSIIGLPSGTTAQPWQLKAILEEEKVAYYEIFDNYLVFYWRSFNPKEIKTIRLDLKADIAGKYQAPASTVYPYYGDEFKTWIKGNTVEILN
ncbi:TonB-dependent receptor plug domain-containing protein [Psychroserpens sp. Hel_I_66]|uniref:TonB-dependent receptor plug domain-containing protein n=1 Tax=Psychroserpens sp. Hel_I_66 TaxID=1250004 RepID=UPI000AEB21EB|nr:TonB-dependent receptor plug domain-containing protein [Psychroserpens sp. Hel_I_66]